MNVAILTISDRVSRGEANDRSGEVLKEMVDQQKWALVHQAVVPDEPIEISELLTTWSDSGGIDLILTTGGTGFSARDQTPEATLAVIDRQVPGLAEAMRAAGLKKTPHAMLSRAVTGIRGATLIVNLPGSPRAVEENLSVILPVLPHAIELLRGDPGAEAGHQLSPPSVST